MAQTQTQSLSDVAESVYSDVEKLIRQHLSQLAEQAKKELGKAAAAGASFGGGAGMIALGTVLGGIGFVHALHRLTGMPLWLCYTISSATACATGTGLFAAGAQTASDVELLPRGTRRSVREAVSSNCK